MVPDSLSSTMEVAPMSRASSGTRGKATSTCSFRVRSPYLGGSMWMYEASIPRRLVATKKKATANTISHFVLIASLNVKDSTPHAPRTLLLLVRVARTSVEAPNTTTIMERTDLATPSKGQDASQQITSSVCPLFREASSVSSGFLGSNPHI